MNFEMTKIKNEASVKRILLSSVSLLLVIYFFIVLIPQPISAAPEIGTYIVTDAVRLRKGQSLPPCLLKAHSVRNPTQART